MSYRVSLNANLNWKFCRNSASVQNRNGKNVYVWDTDYDDSQWEKVALPHTVRHEAIYCSGGKNYQGFCWYRRRFSISPEFENRTLVLEFEAVMQRVDAWLDGEPLGYREGGFLPISFDLTGIDTGREHTLVLRVDNSDIPDIPPGKPQNQLDFCYFGGIYRDAYLHVTHPVHFTTAVFAHRVGSGGLFVRYSDVSKEKATVNVDAHFENKSPNECEVCVQILLDGTVVGKSENVTVLSESEHTEKIQFIVECPKLWHPNHPNLYTLTARILCHGEILDEINERIGIREIEFTPNGFFINGEKLYLNGANRHQEYIYTGFAIPDFAQRRDVRILKEAGINCIRLGHYPQDKAFMDACDEMGVLCIVPTPGWQVHPCSVKFDEASYQNTRQMIRYNRNHPSVCLWEPILNETDYPQYFAKKQLEIVTEEMGGHSVWVACDSRYEYSEHYPVIYSQNSTANRARFVREYGDNWVEQFGPMSTMRRVHRSENAQFYSGGEKAMLRSALERFEEYKAFKSDENLCGAAMWAAIDHNRGYDMSIGAVGMLDLERLPKYLYYLMKSQQDILKNKPECFILNQWTQNSPNDIYVCTNASAVRLSLNGREIGVLDVDKTNGVNSPVVFKGVSFEKGALRAEAIFGGEVVKVCEVITPENPSKIVLRPLWAGETRFVADQSDLLIVHAFIKDENETTVCSAEPMVHFSVTGDAQIVGDGESWVKANPTIAKAGVATVLVRAGESAGEITLTATSDGLKDGIIKLKLEPSNENYLPSPKCETPKTKPTYWCDRQEFFSQCKDIKSNYNYDFCKNKPATASSCKGDTHPQNVNQPKMLNPWLACDNALPQWWAVDLEEEKRLTGMVIRWYHDGVWYRYTVETSLDGTTWETAARGEASGQSLKPIHFSPGVLARHVKINIISATDNNCVGLYKVEIYGEK